MEKFRRLEVGGNPLHEADILQSFVSLFVALAHVNHRKRVGLLHLPYTERHHIGVVGRIETSQIELADFLKSIPVQEINRTYSLVLTAEDVSAPDIHSLIGVALLSVIPSLKFSKKLTFLGVEGTRERKRG